MKSNNIVYPQVAEPANPLVSLESSSCYEKVSTSNSIKKQKSVKYTTSVATVQKKRTVVEQKSSLCNTYIQLNNKPASGLIVRNLNLKPAFPKIIQPINEVKTPIKTSSNSVVLVKDQGSYKSSIHNLHLCDLPQITAFSNLFIYYLKINIKDIYTHINSNDEKNKNESTELIINYNYLNLKIRQKVICTKNLPLYNLEIGLLGIISEILTGNIAKTVFNSTKTTISLNEKKLSHHYVPFIFI